MRYLGGKYAGRATIAGHVLSHGLPVLEPFVGGANLPDLWPAGSHASDTNGALIELYQRVQREGVAWLPDEVTEPEYRERQLAFRAGAPQSALDAFVLVGCSYGGKYGGTFAREGKRNFCSNAKNSLRRLIGTPVEFRTASFLELTPEPGFVVYADPPYRGVTGYGAPFDHAAFAERLQEWAEICPVYVSEYQPLRATWVEVGETTARGVGIKRTSSSLFRVSKRG